MKLWLFLVMATLLQAHLLNHEVTHPKVYSVNLYFAKAGDFSFESYEVYSPQNRDIPYAVGRTDKNGRLFFQPDAMGEWQVKAFSEDGHGTVVKVNVTQISKNEATQRESLLQRLVLGLLAIGAIFGLVYFITKRSKNNAIS